MYIIDFQYWNIGIALEGLRFQRSERSILRRVNSKNPTPRMCSPANESQWERKYNSITKRQKKNFFVFIAINPTHSRR